MEETACAAWRRSRSALAVLVLLPAPAAAQQAWFDFTDERVPAITADRWFVDGQETAEGPTSVGLRGKVWVLAFFLRSSVDKRVASLQDLYAKYEPRGFHVVLMVSSSPGRVRKLVERHGLTFAVGADRGGDTVDRFSTWGGRSYPYYYLMNARGEVVDHAIPSEDELQELLEDVFDPTLPELHPELADAAAAYRSRNFGAAREAAAALAEDADEAVAADALKLVEQVDALAAHLREEYDYEREKYQMFDSVAYGRVLQWEHEFEGTELGTWAKQQGKKLARTDDVKQHRKAWNKLEKALKRELRAGGRAYHVERAVKMYEDMLEDHKYTPAGSVALERVARLADQ